jgi:hypothetical protein
MCLSYELPTVEYSVQFMFISVILSSSVRVQTSVPESKLQMNEIIQNV